MVQCVWVQFVGDKGESNLLSRVYYTFDNKGIVQHILKWSEVLSLFGFIYIPITQPSCDMMQLCENASFNCRENILMGISGRRRVTLQLFTQQLVLESTVTFLECSLLFPSLLRRLLSLLQPLDELLKLLQEHVTRICHMTVSQDT